MKRPSLTIVAAALFSLHASAVMAAAVVIWPVDPVLTAKDKATVLWIENKGDAPVTMQIRTFAWTQPDGEDVLAEQDDLVASPPIAKVAPGGRQLMRIVRRRPAPQTPERAYRILIDELPAPPTGGDAAPARLAVQMRYSIPLFDYAASPDAVAPDLDAHVVLGAQGRMLAIRNDGAEHARLSDIRIIAQGGETVLKPGLAGYVLPGATMRLPVQMQKIGTVRAAVNGVETTLSPKI